MEPVLAYSAKQAHAGGSTDVAGGRVGGHGGVSPRGGGGGGGGGGSPVEHTHTAPGLSGRVYWLAAGVELGGQGLQGSSQGLRGNVAVGCMLTRTLQAWHSP